MITRPKHLFVRHHENFEEQFDQVRTVKMVVVYLAKVYLVSGLHPCDDQRLADPEGVLQNIGKRSI